MHNKNSIIESIYSLNIPRKVWANFDSDLTQDFEQFCYLQLLEIEDVQFFQLCERGEIVPYFTRICQYQKCPKNSEFWKLYKGKLNLISYEALYDSERETFEDFE